MDTSENGHKTQDGLEVEGRRKVLRSLGFAGLFAAGAVQIVPALAQPTPLHPNLVVTPPIGIRPEAKLSSLNRTELAQLKLTRRLPASVSIEKMGLTPEAVAELTPAAKALTKADLVALGTGKVTRATATLTVKDIGSIRAAFGTGYLPGKGGGIAGLDVSCCCCTPCCCAAAANAPFLLQAA